MQVLVRHVLEQFTLGIHCIHGVRHWARVLENGRRLAAENGANVRIIEHFALLHDSRRKEEGHDPLHGRRAAAFARELFDAGKLSLEAEEALVLYEACEGHTRGRGHEDLTVRTCWDADRLDLGRIGIRPLAHFLSTKEARKLETIEWAFRRGLEDVHPPLIQEEWALDL